MKRNESSDGVLYLIATPIGNLEDITYRAVRILGEADMIASEDTRKAKILLDRYSIGNKKIISHHVQNEHKTLEYIIKEVKNGKKVALITEAGSPSISDPGFLLVREAVKNEIKIEIIPGVSALIFAAVACALPVEKFAFYGFLPPKQGARMRILSEIGNDEKTAFIFESPYRIIKLLTEIIEAIGPETDLVLVREATKMHEEIIRGKAAELHDILEKRVIKGEFVVCISNRSKLKEK
ncbi:MAG TPA: 16S rRNA (cytidine(1402)-2'-O)-methyltransferase [Lentisphaeria bacterium]|nr:MAG: 16S rRNA (cytidine(1402)-2'-O)-methyltransferase [Lentisphaerae bacterium GWF2_38_69]HBM16198.1 16S rRNA (cytidine(1402)-2'-O)-methyltransferase [Lentisphaeria bacterium]